MEKWFRMLRNKIKWFIFLLLMLTQAIKAQESTSSQWSINGYLTNMQTFMFQDISKDWMSDNLLHNRLNVKWNSKSDILGITFELRNRLLSGESIKYIPDYIKNTTDDKGWLNLSANLATGNSYVLNSKIDRAYFDLNLDKFQIRVGRQRINWGQCMVWNPNDLFNTYSFFDFDYIEKPGSDAVRLQYYTGTTSSLELAVKADYLNRITAAGLYRFAVGSYDLQFLGGLLNEEDVVVGAGWSGNLGNASFTGECSYFHPKNHFSDSTGVVAASLGSGYTFSNSLTLQAEVLYNPQKNTTFNLSDYYNLDLSAKNLSFSDLSVLLQGSYPITPLFNVSLAGMYFPDIKSYFVGPTFIYSLSQNLDFSFLMQSFSGKFSSTVNQNYNFAFLKMKWSF